MNIEFGFARRNINPERSCSLAGYFNERIWDKILDDLEVRAFTLKYESNYFSIVQFDLVTVTQALADAIYKKIEKSDIFAKESMIITATHTHTAPEIRKNKPGFDAEYQKIIVDRAIEALNHSVANLQQGDVFIGKAQESRFAFNRRYWMKNGSVVTNPPKGSSDIDKPEGEVDLEIPVLKIQNKAGNIKFIMANIVNHADTIGGNSVSADWPGFLIKEMEKNLGHDSMFMPLIGCAGNINHFDINKPSSQASYQEAEQIGMGYASTIKKELENMEELQIPCMKAANAYIEVRSREITEEEIVEAQNTLKKYHNVLDAEKGGELTSLDLAKKTPEALKYFARHLLEAADDKETNIFNLTGLALGNIRIVSLPAEPFVEIGLNIKNEIFPDNFTMVVSHSNGTGNTNKAGGYIPNKWNYGRGGYETTPRSSPFSMETSEKLLKGIRDLKEKLS